MGRVCLASLLTLCLAISPCRAVTWTNYLETEYRAGCKPGFAELVDELSQIGDIPNAAAPAKIKAMALGYHWYVDGNRHVPDEYGAAMKKLVAWMDQAPAERQYVSLLILKLYFPVRFVHTYWPESADLNLDYLAHAWTMYQLVAGRRASVREEEMVANAIDARRIYEHAGKMDALTSTEERATARTHLGSFFKAFRGLTPADCIVLSHDDWKVLHQQLKAAYWRDQFSLFKAGAVHTAVDWAVDSLRLTILNRTVDVLTHCR
jgi:Asp-tRNA(Asn)/Glu-tRNA(Gln) amidotransferase A subunit family amidase